MIRRIRQLLGWDPEPVSLEPGYAEPTAVRSGAARTPKATARPKPAPEPQAARTGVQRLPLDLLGDDALSLDTSEEAGFDPYNTGVFDRSASWDRISKSKGR